MKKLMIVLFSLGLAFGASAQRGGFHGGVVAGGGHFYGGHGYYGGGWGYPRAYVGLGFGAPWWGWGYGWYGPWYGGYPAYYYGYGAMPNQLELQVHDIKDDYAQRIKDVKHDKALTRSERRAKIDQLKTERDNAIVDARHTYFYNSRRNFNQQYPNQQNQQPQPQQQNPPKNGNNGSSSSEGPEYQDNSAGSK